MSGALTPRPPASSPPPPGPAGTAACTPAEGGVPVAANGCAPSPRHSPSPGPSPGRRAATPAAAATPTRAPAPDAPPSPSPSPSPSPARPPRAPTAAAPATTTTTTTSTTAHADDLKARLCLELERKLRLASEAAELSSDRDAICGQVFSDIVGELDGTARAALLPEGGGGAAGGVGGGGGRPGTGGGGGGGARPPASAPPPPAARPVLFYEVLAPYLAARPARAEGLLTVARRLWGQPYVAPTFALLLHRWLLGPPRARPSPAPPSSLANARARHLLVLVRGAQQLFWADVHAGAARFAPLYAWLVRSVVLVPPGGRVPGAARLADLPFNPRVGLVNVTAAFAPYYLGPDALGAALAAWPSAAAADGGGAGAPPAPGARPPPAPPPASSLKSGPATLLTEAADMLGLMKGEAGLLTYLDHIRRGWAGAPALAAAPRGARLRLEAELYGLTARGGPRYLPASVRDAAFGALDELFPAGRAPRRLVAAGARLWWHPAALPAAAGEAALMAAGWAGGALKWVGSTLGLTEAVGAREGMEAGRDLARR